VLAWDGCINVRDLGGLPTEDGGETRFHVVVRADSIHGLTSAGWEALRDYGVRAAIDLRGRHEREDDPPGDPPIPVVSIPVNPRDESAVWHWPSMSEAYLAILERFRPAYAEVIEVIAEHEPPIVIHCQGGRDRTGLAVALLLRLAGVDPETISADHGLSDESWAVHNLAWFEDAKDPEERARRRRIAAPAGRTMADILTEIDRRHASVREYLRGGGATDQALTRVEARLKH